MRNATLSLAFLAMIGATFASACAIDHQSRAGQETEQSLIIADGRAIAETQCASCHAITSQGASPLAAAPPLRGVLASYDQNELAADFIEGVAVAHPEMPDFQFGPAGADSLIAYIASIQETPAR